MRSTTHAFVVMLACYDLSIGLLGVLEQYLMLTSVYNQVYHHALCKALMVVISSMIMGDMFSILFLTLDRFICITYPLRYPYIVTYRKVAVAAVFTIMYSPVSKIVILMTSQHTDDIVCDILQFAKTNYTVYLLVPELGMVASVLVICYSKITFITCKQIYADKRRYTRNEGNQLGEMFNQSKAQLRVTKVVSMVIGVYLFTTMFGTASTLKVALSPSGVTSDTFDFLGYWLWKVSHYGFIYRVHHPCLLFSHISKI